MILNLLFLMGVWIFKVWWVGVLSALLSMTLYIKTSYRVTVVVTSVISVVVWGALCFKEEVDVFFYPSGAVYGAVVCAVLFIGWRVGLLAGRFVERKRKL